MKQLIIVSPTGQQNLSSIVGSYKIFDAANRYRQEQGGQPVFQIQLAGVSGDIEFHQGLFTVHPHCSIRDIEKTDLVIIPALNSDFGESIKQNGELIAWIAKQYKEGASIASLCTGAFLLASTGLLNGRHCSTHWLAADAFRQMFPEVDVVSDRIITDEYGIFTSGGAYSFLNLLLYLLEKYYDRQTALYCSKVFEIDIDRHSQSPFSIFSGQKDHQDEVVIKAQQHIEKTAFEKMPVSELATLFSVSRRNFDRRFKKATGNTPAEYLQRVRIEAAKKALETSRKTVGEVMYETGYSDMKAFRETFRRITGLAPAEYRNKYNKEAAVLPGPGRHPAFS